MPDVLVAVVADGAGSATHGGIGAEIAAQAALQAAVQTLCPGAVLPVDDAGWHELLRGALQSARAALVQHAAQIEVPLRELATTLILVCATPELAAAAQVGDGAAVVEDRAGRLLALTVPRAGEYINETTFLTAAEAVAGAELAVVRSNVFHLAAFSDGLQMLALKMPEGAPHGPFFAPLFRFLDEQPDGVAAHDQLASFLRSSRIRERTDDDLTLVLAGLIEEGPPADTR